MAEIQKTQRGKVESPLPRVTIQFCTQCKWLLRAAYYAQELLSTFGTALGEVSLQPSTGGTFVVSIVTAASKDVCSSEGEEGGTEKVNDVSSEPEVSKTLWDRKTDGGFPETKELKRRVRDVIEPGRDLGHVDREYGKKKKKEEDGKEEGGKDKDVAVKEDVGKGKEEGKDEKKECEDCK